jgi:S-adenosylmethionine decarboxylase
MTASGELLIVDALTDSDRLSEVAHIRRFVEAVVQACDLRPVFTHLEEFPNGTDFGPGITAVAILTESHLVVHTAPNRGSLNVDLFSCRTIKIVLVLNLVREFFPKVDIRSWDCIER